MADLEVKLRGLIADAHGISVDEVTPEFIHDEREKLYARPDHTFQDDRPGLEVKTTAQIETDRLQALLFLYQVRGI